MYILKFITNFVVSYPLSVVTTENGKRETEKQKLMETVKDRLLRYLRAEGISNSKFARDMGVSVAYIGAMRKSMPETKVAKLMEVYPDLNRDWLLYGEGEMRRQTSREQNSTQWASNDYEGYVVPLLPVEAFAGTLQEWSEGVRLQDCRRVMSPIKGADIAIDVNGDSMEPNIHNGSRIFIKKINDAAFIPWGNPIVIDTQNGVLVKVIQPSKDGDEVVEAHSYNEKYPPMKITKSSILGLYRVLATVNTSRLI